MYTIKDLAVSPVVFDEIPHTYTLNGKQLSGITGIIHQYVFPDKYKGIPSRILNAAAERGHRIHSQVQMIVEGYDYAEPDLSVKDLFKWVKENGIKFIASEYLVSDEQNVATAIDILDSMLNLYDIKTTDKLDTEYLSWQLSTCAYLFEKQNPKKKVNELFGIHLRNGKARVVRVDRIDDAIIADLIWAAAAGLPWSNPLKPVNIDIMNSKDVAKMVEIESQITAFEQNLAALKEQEENMKKGLLELMLRTGVNKWVSPNGKLTLSVRQGSVRCTFDSKRFKENYPELYEHYVKESLVNPSLIIKTNV
jgi:hypothetical protein